MDAMSPSLQEPSPSTPNFQPIFEKALKEYKTKTGSDLTAYPLATEINGCASPQAILAVLERKANELNQSQTCDERLKRWLGPTVNIIVTLSATIGQGVGLVFPPTTIIFSGIGILLVAAKSTVGSRDKLVELFNRIESFFKRINTYTEVPPTPELIDALAKIMAEVLVILAIATKGIKKKRRKIFFEQLAGRNDIEDALQRFGKLEQGEFIAVIAQVSTDARGLKDDAKETKADVKEIISKLDTRERESFLRALQAWLSPPEPSTNYEFGLDACHKGTAKWFIDGKIFRVWDEKGSLLWIHGKPGSGKSILWFAISIFSPYAIA
ncbi:hypothetical protein EI94DRAFT_1806712 [Lactarius quietus]|nr:hypothetical protein EI94DRAFT_1806712 [Lactarius quietus]